MDSEMLKTVGQIAGIGGIALGVLLVIFREVIRKTIFPTLTKEQGYRLLKLIVILVWAVAVFWNRCLGICRDQAGPDFGTRRVDVTDVFVDDYRKDFSAIVDFRLTNRGNRPLSLSRVRSIVLEIKEITTLGELDFSANCDLDISNL